jgi:hypothetical protein
MDTLGCPDLGSVDCCIRFTYAYRLRLELGDNRCSRSHVVEDVPLITYVGLALMVLGALALGIAWRWERLGGTIAVVSQLVFLTLSLIKGPVSLDPNFVVPCLMSITIAIPGILFLVCWWRSRKRVIPQQSA